MRAAFLDRLDAARRLAGALSRYRGTNPLVLAIPRGGVPIARVIADTLDGELDVVLVRKLGAPFSPEFAVGAVDEAGQVRLTGDAEAAGADSQYIEQEAARQLDLIRRRRRLYRPDRQPADPAGRVVIVVDDGLATGATMTAALESVRSSRPRRLICAVPVAARESLQEVGRIADETVCLLAPQDFRAVGGFYIDFSAVDDNEVMQLLTGSGSRSGCPGADERTVMLEPTGLAGDLVVPDNAAGLVVFAHGSGSGRRSPRNRAVASALNRQGLATLLFDLLTRIEDEKRDNRFDIALLSTRLEMAVVWASQDAQTKHLPIALFGASTGAAAAVQVAARRPDLVRAVVSRGGRPDLADDALASVEAPTLLIVGGADQRVLELNQVARMKLACPNELSIVPGATHLFEEPGAMDEVCKRAAAWFLRWIVPNGRAKDGPRIFRGAVRGSQA